MCQHVRLRRARPDQDLLIRARFTKLNVCIVVGSSTRRTQPIHVVADIVVAKLTDLGERQRETGALQVTNERDAIPGSHMDRV